MTGTGTRKLAPTLALALALAVPLAACDNAIFLSPEQQLDAEIASDPTLTEVYAVLEQEFPEDYHALRATLLAGLEADRTGESAYYDGQNYMISFMSGNAHHFAAAPNANLFEVREESEKVIDMLAAESTGMCARYAMVGLAHDDEPHMRTEMQLSRLTVAQVRAMAAGRDNPVAREPASEADWIAYGDALFERGMTDDEIDAFYAGGDKLMAHDEASQCRIGQAIYHALADLPEGVAERMAAVMLLPAE